MVVAAVAAVRSIPALREANRISLGIKGEKSVAEVLDELKTRGYRVFHDLQGEGFNIDHVAVGPAGVFVIETKARTKPPGRDATVTFDGKCVLVNGLAPDRDPVAQARAGAAFIRGLVARVTGFAPTVRPVVLFPWWYVQEGPHGADVWVLNPTRFLGFVRHEPESMSADGVGRVSEVISDAARRKGQAPAR